MLGEEYDHEFHKFYCVCIYTIKFHTANYLISFSDCSLFLVIIFIMSNFMYPKVLFVAFYTLNVSERKKVYSKTCIIITIAYILFIFSFLTTLAVRVINHNVSSKLLPRKNNLSKESLCIQVWYPINLTSILNVRFTQKYFFCYLSKEQRKAKERLKSNIIRQAPV